MRAGPWPYNGLAWRAAAAAAELGGILLRATHSIGAGPKKGSGGRRRRRRAQSNDDNNNNNIPSSTPNTLATPHYCSPVVTAAGRPSLVFYNFIFPLKIIIFSIYFYSSAWPLNGTAGND